MTVISSIRYVLIFAMSITARLLFIPVTTISGTNIPRCVKDRQETKIRRTSKRLKELQDFINRFSANAAKSKQATSRKKQLDALEMIEMPVSSRRFPYVDFKPDRECGNDLLRVDHLTKTIGDRKVLDDISFVIHPREKVAFVGSDVVAKTTLF